MAKTYLIVYYFKLGLNKLRVYLLYLIGQKVRDAFAITCKQKDFFFFSNVMYKEG